HPAAHRRPDARFGRHLFLLFRGRHAHRHPARRLFAHLFAAGHRPLSLRQLEVRLPLLRWYQSIMASVEFQNVTKSFGSFTAVSAIALEIGDGEFVCLLGPSGCGKTTSLRMIAGLENPTSGKVLIGGKDVTNLHPKDRQISMVFQDYALYPH